MHFLRNVEHVYAANKKRRVLVYFGQFQDAFPGKFQDFGLRQVFKSAPVANTI